MRTKVLRMDANAVAVVHGDNHKMDFDFSRIFPSNVF